jgi:hypothetical protein
MSGLPPASAPPGQTSFNFGIADVVGGIPNVTQALLSSCQLPPRAIEPGDQTDHGPDLIPTS